MTPPKAIIYTRVSTKDKGQTTENQINPLLAYAHQKGWDTEIVEETQSAVKNRPELERILRLVRERKVNIILVYKVDRLARSLSDFVQIIKTLTANNVRFIIPSQGIDTDQTNPAARMMMNMLAVIAEFERDLISERVKAGMDRARREGKPLGPPCKVVDKYEVLKLRGEGLSLRNIGARLGVGKGKIENMLKETKETLK